MLVKSFLLQIRKYMENILFKGEYLLKLDTVKEAFWTTNKKNIITYVFLLVLELLV
jgi:hypothetical protein